MSLLGYRELIHSGIILIAFLLVKAGPGACTVEVHDEDHLSKHSHYEGEYHNTEYDHDAFLGPKQAKEFEELSEEDAKKRLRVMVPRLDTDKDGEISVDELEAWIEKQRKTFMYDAVDESIESEDKDGDKMISWGEYMKARFGEWEHENYPKDEVKWRIYIYYSKVEKKQEILKIETPNLLRKKYCAN